MRKTVILFLFTFFGFMGNAQFFEGHLGYNVAFLTQGAKELEHLAFRFNNEAQSITTEMKPSNAMRGLYIGYGGLTDNQLFGVTIAFKQRRMSFAGDRIDQNGREDYQAYKLAHNAFDFSVTFGSEQFRIGYGFEIGRLKFQQKTETEPNKWKKVSDSDFTASLKLCGQIRLMGNSESIGLYICPYWRTNGAIQKLLPIQSSSAEYYFGLRTFGVDFFLAFNLGD